MQVRRSDLQHVQLIAAELLGEQVAIHRGLGADQPDRAAGHQWGEDRRVAEVGADRGHDAEHEPRGIVADGSRAAIDAP